MAHHSDSFQREQCGTNEEWEVHYIADHAAFRRRRYPVEYVIQGDPESNESDQVSESWEWR